MSMIYKTNGSVGAEQETTDGYRAPAPNTADTLVGGDVCNRIGKDPGDIREIMLETGAGRVACTAPPFGGFLGMEARAFRVAVERLGTRYGGQAPRAECGKMAASRIPRRSARAGVTDRSRTT